MSDERTSANPDLRVPEPDPSAVGAPNVHHEPMPEGKEAPPPGWRIMSVVRWILVVLMASAASVSVWHYFGGFSGGSAQHAAAQYYCPMHPSVVQDHPGECPICGMTLVPRDAATSPSTSASSPTLAPSPTPSASVPGLVPIELTFDRVQLIGMKTSVAVRESLASDLRMVGVVAAPESGLARVNARVSGWVERLFVTETGQRVTRGQPLAMIYSPQILAAEQELLNAKRWRTLPGLGDAGDGLGAAMAPRADGALENDARHRLELLGVARGEIDAIEREGVARTNVTLASPASGYLVAKKAVQGLYFQPGTDLFAIADLSTVWVLADAFELDAARVRLGERAELRLVSFPGESFVGKVGFVYPSIETSTRTLRLRVEVANKALRLKPGMFGEVTVSLPVADGIVVPSEAVVDTGDVQYVFVARGAGHFEPRRVHVGLKTDAKTQIVDGVAVGETVVTTGNFLLDSESRLRATIEGTATVGAAAASNGGMGGAARAPAPGEGPSCAADFDASKYPDKFRQCRTCEALHRGMGSMEEDCKKAIAKPWR